ncbi:MAG: sodium/proline symporter PutP [Puniceicoccales bacterium]|jgi:sodium/proline symporter|nr:sodium/proline symporter PutP [Puniceicoccales bacterium]
MHLKSFHSDSFLWAALVYFAAMACIGLFFCGKSKSVSDYLLGGRKLGAWVTSLSAEASDMSAWLLMGLPGFAYVAGGAALWIVGGLIVGTYCNWKFIAGRLRAYTEIAGDSITIPDFLQKRFCSPSNTIKLISAVFIFFFFVIYVSSGFAAGGKLFSLILPLTYRQAMLISASVMIFYTFLGGFSAVCWTDALQGMLMFFAVIAVPILAILYFGGVAPTAGLLSATGDNFLNPMFGTNNTKFGLGEIISMAAWGLGYFGQPHILVRFMAIRSNDEIPLARKIAMHWLTLSLVAAAAVGILGNVWQEIRLSGGDVENIFIAMVGNMCPKFLTDVILLGVLATIMSTTSSQLLVAASSFAGDIYGIAVRKNASPRELLFVSRMAVLIVSVLSIALSMSPNTFILDVVAYAWAGFGACLGPALLFALFFRRTTENGVLCGIIAGGLCVVIWKKFAFFNLYEIVPAFILSSAVIFIVSLMDRAPAQNILQKFDLARQKTMG